ncbi:glycosyl hydrolase family 18 protein, partial [Streptomyces xanthophaeus]
MHIRKPLIAAAATAALAAGALASFAGLGTAQAAGAGTTAAAGGVRIAYYDQWSVYGTACAAKHLDSRGRA